MTLTYNKQKLFVISEAEKQIYIGPEAASVFATAFVFSHCFGTRGIFPRLSQLVSATSRARGQNGHSGVMRNSRKAELSHVAPTKLVSDHPWPLVCLGVFILTLAAVSKCRQQRAILNSAVVRTTELAQYMFLQVYLHAI